jgi:RNA polymerase sigma-70 factor (ECF subfamily)
MRNGGERALDFEEVYTREFPGVYKYLLALSGSPALAEELTQETFYRAIKNSETFRGTCKLSVWLCQIGKNLYISQLRKERHFKALSPDEMNQERTTHPDPEETLLRRDTAMTIHRLLHALPEPYKEVFSLRILGELSFAQIGDLFGKSESWARVTYHRAKLKLKEDTP